MAEKSASLGTGYWKLWSASVISNLGDGISIVAYPWLASAVTRNPVLIALIGVVQRLPWLVFTLPAGVITDRVDRRKIITSMNLLAFAVTLAVAVLVLVGQGSLPDPGKISSGEFETGPIAYLGLLYVSALVFGFAEVLRDNASQTILPAVVEADQLERANGTLWGAEMVANSFAGPPLGGFLIAVAFSLPFFVDAGSFLAAALLVGLIAGSFQPKGRQTAEGGVRWRAEIAEGFMWLWRHSLLRTLAIVLGLLNGLAMMEFAIFVLFAQEILEVEATLFGILASAAALGGVLGSVLSSRISSIIGSGSSLHLALAGSAVGSLLVGVTSSWPVAYLAFALTSFLAVLWNVITVSLRQMIIPDELLGRVNSVYRFFGWGMMPIGSAIGGGLVALFEVLTTRTLALRMPFLLGGAAYLVIFVFAAPRLTTGKIEGARREAEERGARTP